MRAPLGALVSIYYDSPRRVAPGDALVTPGGRTYLIAEVRIQARGKHVGRQHLKCIVGDGSEKVAGETYPIYWYPRRRKAGKAPPAGG